MQKPICVSRCKITTFPQTRKGMEEILLQCIGFGCLFLHELPLMYHELSLIVCFTRITVNVPRIVINCLGDIASGGRWLQQPCHASMGMCGGWHLWLHAGVPLRSTTCLLSCRPYGAPLQHLTSPRNSVASRHREARSDPFITDLCKICFQKKTSISFPVSYPTAND